MEENESKKKKHIFLDNSANRIPNWLKQAERRKTMIKGLQAIEILKKRQWVDIEHYTALCELIEKELKDYETLQDDFNKLYERTYKELKALEIIKEIAKSYDIEFCDSKQTISFKIMLKDKFILEIIAIQDIEEYELLKEVLL